MYIIDVVEFFLAWWLSNQLNFLVAVQIYKICVFDEAFFFLTIRIPMIIMLFKVVTCCNMLDDISTEWS